LIEELVIWQDVLDRTKIEPANITAKADIVLEIAAVRCNRTAKSTNACKNTHAAFWPHRRFYVPSPGLRLEKS
jgi:hypothetical protein